VSNEEQKRDAQKVQAGAWFEGLRDRICAALEAVEDEFDLGAQQRFMRRDWQREGGGGGTMAMLKGRVFEKTVETLTPAFSKTIRVFGRAVSRWSSIRARRSCRRCT
jgi:coproporphyrinogen III oxidase